MKVVLVTLLLIFISTSFALGNTRRLGKQVSVHSLHLEKISTLGSALKGLIQLADADELEPVIEIIQEITEELQSLLTSNQNDLAVLTQQYESDKAAAEQAISDTSASLDSAESDLASSQEWEANLQEAIATDVQNINDASAAVDAENQRRAGSHAAYQQHVADATEALSDLNEAAAILAEIGNEDLSGSFIQVQKKKLFKSLSLVQKKLNKANLRTTPAQIYVKQLIQMTQDAEASGTVNADLFAQIYVVVESFKAALQQEIDQTEQADEDDGAQSQQTLDTLNNVIEALQADLQYRQNYLSAVQEHIAEVQGNIETLEQTLAAAQANLQSIEDNYAQVSAQRQGYISRLEVDIDVLQRALVFVQSENAQLGNAEDGRNAFSFGNNGAAASAASDDEDENSAAAEPEQAPEEEAPQLDPNWVTAPLEEVDYVPAVIEAPVPDVPDWQTGPAEAPYAASEGSDAESDEEAASGSEEGSDEESDEAVSAEPASQESDEESEAASAEPASQGSDERSEEESDEESEAASAEPASQGSDEGSDAGSDEDEVDFL